MVCWVFCPQSVELNLVLMLWRFMFFGKKGEKKNPFAQLAGHILFYELTYG